MMQVSDMVAFYPESNGGRNRMVAGIEWWIGH
jgi:hypothetical protein